MLRVLNSGDTLPCQLRRTGLRSPRPAWGFRQSRVLLRPATQPGVKRAARTIWTPACAATKNLQATPSDPSGVAGASRPGPNVRRNALEVVQALAKGGLVLAGLWCITFTDGKGKALLAFWLAQQLATLLPLWQAAMPMQIVLRKRLPGLVATGLSAVWLASAHLLAQAALAVPLTMVKVLLAYHPLRIHLWVPAAVESWIWQNASLFNTLFGVPPVLQDWWFKWAFLAWLILCVVQVPFTCRADPTAGTRNIFEKVLSLVALWMVGYSDAETAQPGMKSVQPVSSSKQSDAPAEAAPAMEGHVQKGPAGGSSSSSSGRPVEQWLQQGQELHATLPLGMPQQLPEWQDAGQLPDEDAAAQTTSSSSQSPERDDVTSSPMTVEVCSPTSEAARLQELLGEVASLQEDKARAEKRLRHFADKGATEGYKEAVGRGLSLLSAHGTAMLCAVHGEADWGAGDLEDPLLRARDCVSGSMSDEDIPYEIGRKALHPELANVDRVLTNIKNRELPYAAIGSFVKILVAFIQKAITNHDNVVEQKNHLQQKLDAAAKQAQEMQETDHRHISDLETLNKMLRRELEAVRKQVVAASGSTAASTAQRQLDTVQRQLRAEELQKQELDRRLQGALGGVLELEAAAKLQKEEQADLALHLEQAQAALKARDAAHQEAVQRLEEVQADNTKLKAASEAKQADLDEQLESVQAALADSVARESHLRRQLEQQAAEHQQLQADVGAELGRQAAHHSLLLADHEELQDDFQAMEKRHEQLQDDYGMLEEDSREREAELLTECEGLKAESVRRQADLEARLSSLSERLWQIESEAEDSDPEDSEAEDSEAEDTEDSYADLNAFLDGCFTDAEDSDAEESEAEDSDAEESEAEDSDAEGSDAEDSDAEESGAKDADAGYPWWLVNDHSSNEERQPDTHNLGAHNIVVAAEVESSDNEEDPVIEVLPEVDHTSDSDEEGEASDKEGDGVVEVSVAPELLPGQGGKSSAGIWTSVAEHPTSFAVTDLDGSEDGDEVAVSVAAELLPQAAAEAAKAPIAIDESTLYGTYNPTTGKVDLTGRWPQFLEAYAQLAPSQRIAVSELCSKLINTCKLPAGYAPDLAYYMAAVLKLKASEVEQLEPDLVDHYNRLQSLATTLGRRLMLSDVKQSDPYLTWQRHGDDPAGLMHLLPRSAVARRLAGL